MSAGHTTHYRVAEASVALRHAGLLFKVETVDGYPVDCYRTRIAAEHAARELCSGSSSIQSRGTLGCRVQPFPVRNMGGISL